jgi:O-antigen/teichoic acid export membrane protein
MRYPPHVITAGLVGGTSLVLFAGVLVYRVAFKARLAMERDATAELISVVAFIPLVMTVAESGGGLVALMGAHVLSRVVYLLAAAVLGRQDFRPSIGGVGRQDIHATLRASSVIGAIGLLAGSYELLDLLVLSKLAPITAVAHYSAAQRLIWPILMALAAVAGTLYPVAASYWPQARETFEASCQRGVDTVAVLAGLAFSALLAGPEFFLSLLSQQLGEAAVVLRVLAVLCFVKAITSTVGPLLYIVGAQSLALRFVVTSVVIKCVVLTPLASAGGALGVAIGSLGIELLWGVTATVYLFQRFSGCRLQWLVAIKSATAMAAAAAIAVLIFPSGGLPAALTAPMMYALLVALSGTVGISDVHLLLGRRPA